MYRIAGEWMETELLIALALFVGRVLDVSLGTIRMILTVSGSRWWAALLGFLELVIWVLAVGGVVTNLGSPIIVIAYAGGFAVGTLVGVTLEGRLALGFRTVTIINRDPTRHVASGLRALGYTATRIEGSGRDGTVEVVIAVIRRRHLEQVRRALQELAPQAFVSIERAERPLGGAPEASVLSTRSRWRALVRK